MDIGKQDADFGQNSPIVLVFEDQVARDSPTLGKSHCWLSNCYFTIPQALAEAAAIIRSENPHSRLLAH